VVLAETDQLMIHPATFTLLKTMRSNGRQNNQTSSLIHIQQRIITTSSHSTNSSQIPARSLLYQAIIERPALQLLVNPWC